MHTNIISKDWKKLSEFYIKVFECKETSQERHLKGEWLEKGTGIKGAELRGAHLLLPGYEGKEPTLEIFQYTQMEENITPSMANRKGYGHIAFSTENVKDTVDKVVANGGDLVGEIVEKDYGSGILTFAYVTDPEGNIIEIQNWQQK